MFDGLLEYVVSLVGVGRLHTPSLTVVAFEEDVNLQRAEQQSINVAPSYANREVVYS